MSRIAVLALILAIAPPAWSAEPPKDFTNSVGMKFKLIPAGEFMMGSPKMGKRQALDRLRVQNGPGPFQWVRITRPFYLGVYEVTQGQWEAVLGTTPWRGKPHVKDGPDYPASYVNLRDVHEFCKKLSDMEGEAYRLPREAEWEHACLAGSTGLFQIGFDGYAPRLEEYAWFDKNASGIGEEYAHEVGKKKANAFGLYDMHGNVAEWCSDKYGGSFPKLAIEGPPQLVTSPWTQVVRLFGSDPASSKLVIEDPTGPAGGRNQVVRGGSWDDPASRCTPTYRGRNIPGHRSSFLGFRVAIVPPSK